MRSEAGRARRAGLLLLGLLAIVSPASAGPAPAGTDAFELEAPGKPWKRALALDPPGRLTWNTDEERTTSGQLRVSFEGVRALAARAAVAELLDREKAIVRDGVDRVPGVERGGFVADSLSTGGLTWYGFRVDIRTPVQAGVITRWVALHPEFPRRRRAFLVALDEATPRGARPVSRTAAAQAALRSLKPRGTGLAGGIATAWLDARTAAFAARLDTTTRLCWQHRGGDVAPSRAWLGLGRGLAVDGDFYQLTDLVPPDSVVDAGSSEYGAAFDRNGDGRVDLVILNRGLSPARGAIMLPVAATLADDDFDGRIDGAVIENGDADGDGRADHRILVLDTNHDGLPDRALRFVDATTEKSSRPLPTAQGIVRDRVVGNAARMLDFGVPWREAQGLLAEIDRVRAACPR